jgi:hypothetical protein
MLSSKTVSFITLYGRRFDNVVAKAEWRRKAGSHENTSMTDQANALASALETRSTQPGGSDIKTS